MNEATTVRITAPNGVTWTRRPGGSSTGQQLLHALTELQGMYSDVSHRWNWWQEGREEQEHDRVLQVVREWDNGAPSCSEGRPKRSRKPNSTRSTRTWRRTNNGGPISSRGRTTRTRISDG